MFKPIDITSSWNVPDGVTAIRHDDEDAISKLFLGHRVVKVDENHIQLDNGTVIRPIGNEGGCVCSQGDYYLTELNGVDNIITLVEFQYDPASDDSDGDGYYRLFVYADNQKINLMEFKGDDGNGYYGTGYELFVRPNEIETTSSIIDAEIVE